MDFGDGENFSPQGEFAAQQQYTFDQQQSENSGDFFNAAADAGDTPFGGEQAAFTTPVPVDQFAAAAAVPAAPAVMSLPVAAAADAANPLVEFNKQFRAINEEKDAKERDAKAARKAGGKAALKKLLSDRAGVVEARKAKNREDEAAKEKEAMDALEGESWGRVVSLINIHGAAAAAAAPEAGGKGKKAASSSGGSGSSGDGHDTSRHKDLLISLKSSPLPKQ